MGLERKSTVKLKLKELKEKIVNRIDRKFLESIGCCNCFKCGKLTKEEVEELLKKIDEK